MLILVLCREEHHLKLIPGYAEALRRRGIDLHYVQGSLNFDSPISEILRQCPTRPSWVFQFDSDYPLLPSDLVKSEIPTVCFRTDVYLYTSRQFRWSTLFDHAAIFHPGYEDAFRKAGHAGALLLPWAIRRDLFQTPDPVREFEVGWAGQIGSRVYKQRARLLPIISSVFHMNDWRRSYTLSEVVEVYRRSRVVVNIGRDDFPQDANMRVFEVMASGTLLITALPNELSRLGFKEGDHFIGYRHESEVIPLIRSYLSNESERLRITEAARAKVLEEHTYDARVETLLRHLRAAGEARLSPARTWPEHRVRLMYLDFFSSVGLPSYCFKEFWRIAVSGSLDTFEAITLIIKALIRSRERNN
jgi:Glycosyl transferases group 1